MYAKQSVNNHSFGFSAFLKIHPSDFKVIEYDEDGLPSIPDAHQICSTINGFKPVLCQNVSTEKKSRKKPDNSLVSPSEVQAHKKLRLSTRDEDEVSTDIPLNRNSCEKALSSLISSDALQWLERSETQSEDTDLLELGEFTNKNKRTLIHKCIRYLYPHLSTVSNNNCIQVQFCEKYNCFKKLLGQEKATSFIQFACVLCHETSKYSHNITGDFGKDQRRLIHREIDNYFGSFLMSKTKTHEQIQFIEVKKKPSRKHTKKEMHFCKFVLYKNNTETLNAIQQLARSLDARPHQFSYAGTKDKRSESWQFMTVNGVDIDRLKAAAEKLPDWLQIRDVCTASSSLHLGALSKNRFVIKLRNVTTLKTTNGPPNDAVVDGDDVECVGTDMLKAKIEKSLESIASHGFINYFGAQRFGSKCGPVENVDLDRSQEEAVDSETFEAPSIGKAILQQDLRSAVNTLLLPMTRGVVDEETSTNNIDDPTCYLRQTGDIDGTIKRLHSSKVRQLSLLRALRKFGSNLKEIDEKASSSGEFATLAYSKALLSLPHNALAFYAHAYCSLLWNKAASHRLEKHGEHVASGDLVLTDGSSEVHVVTQSDVDSGSFSLNDVVLPLPGNRVLFPPNMESFYLESLAEDGVLRDNTDMKSLFRNNKLRLNCPGSYRRVLEFPRHMHYRWSEEDTEEDLSSSHRCDGSDLHLSLLFDLRPSCYATTLLEQLSRSGIKQRRC